MTPPELRITDADVADAPRRDVPCRHCHRSGACHCRGVDPDWCCECGGAAVWSVAAMDKGASARLGAWIVEALPHLRHATWPPVRRRMSRAAIGALVGLATMGGGAVAGMPWRRTAGGAR